MKRLIVIPLVILLLCGCVQKRQVTPILNNIYFKAEIDYNNNEYIADVTITDDAVNIVVTEPQQIKGLTFEITKNGITAEFKGISYSSDINSLPQHAVAQVLCNILNDISGKNTVYLDDENCKIIGRVDDYKYNFEFSPSGLPISLKVDELDLEINFKNVTVS